MCLEPNKILKFITREEACGTILIIKGVLRDFGKNRSKYNNLDNDMIDNTAKRTLWYKSLEDIIKLVKLKRFGH